MYRVVIIEDEKIAADNLIRMIKEVDDTFEIIESVSNSVKILPNIEFDIAFIDIHLKDGNAFELLEKLT